MVLSVNVLLTGANGFLGRAILSRLLNSDVSVYATDFGPAGRISGAAYRKADITRPEELKPVLESANTVIHVAGLAHIFSPDGNSIERFRQVNEIGTANVASAASAAGVGHLILISSVSVYGPYTQGMYDESAPCNPVGPYALSKYKAELRAMEVARKSGMALTILRLATLYGEEDPGNVGRLIRSIDRGRFVWIGRGENLKSLLHREDAARACIAAIKTPISGINIYNVSAPPCKMCDIVAAITNSLGKSVPSWHVPASFALNSAKILRNLSFNCSRLSTVHDTLQKWMADDYYDVDKLCKTFNFKTHVRMEEGIQREVKWYKDSSGRIN